MEGPHPSVLSDERRPAAMQLNKLTATQIPEQTRGSQVLVGTRITAAEQFVGSPAEFSRTPCPCNPLERDIARAFGPTLYGSRENLGDVILAVDVTDVPPLGDLGGGCLYRRARQSPEPSRAWTEANSF